MKKNLPNYLVHEEQYKSLKKENHKAWGGNCAQFRTDGWFKTIDKLLAFDFFPSQGNLIEIGCGTGIASRKFASFGFKVSGVDISETAIAWAKEEAKKENLNINYSVSSVTRLEIFSDNMFDIAIDGNCLHCIIGDDRKKVFTEIYRVLKSSGLFCVSTKIESFGATFPEDKFNKTDNCLYENEIPYRYFASVDSLFSEVKEAGFSLIGESIWFNENKTHINFCCKKIF